MAKDRIVIPGIGKDAARAIIDRMRAQEERIALLERTAGRSGVISSDTAAKPGEFLNIEAPSSETITIVLPESTPARRNARVTLAFRNANPVRIVAVAGTVNGEAFATTNQVGTFDAVADGLSGWSVQLGMTSAGPSGGALDAEYVLGAVHASLPNGRVATDSAEVDAVLTTPNVISWALNVASVAFSKLANLTGLSVLGRAANSAGVMAAITATAGYQALRSNATGTAIGWENYLPTSHIPASITGLQNPYLLPAGFAHGDTLRLTITGDTTIRAILDSTGTRDTLPEGFEFNLCLSDQSGGSAPGWFLDIEDNAAVTGLEGFFRTPGQVQGTSPGPSYRMRSEEEGCRVAMQFGNWRIIGGTAGQLINGAVTVAAGNGSTRASQFSGIRDNGVLETARGFMNFRDSNSMSAFVVQDAANDELEVTFGRNALTGDITAPFDSGVTAIAAGVIVDADVNASAAIAQTKLGATTGFSVKASGSAATTSAEPIVTYSASANMSAERVTTSSTSITVSTSVASQIEFQRAALTGDVTASANSNATTIANDTVSNAKLRDSGALSVIGRSANSAGDPADISAVAASDSVLRESGSVLGFGTIATGGIADDAVTVAKMQNLAAFSLLGRAGSGTGDMAAITTAGSGSVMRDNGATGISFGTLLASSFADATISRARLTNMAAATVVGRARAAGTGAPTDLTGTQVGVIARWESFVVDSTSSGTDTLYDIDESTIQVNFKINVDFIIQGMTATSATFGKRVRFQCDRGFTGTVTWEDESSATASALERIRNPGTQSFTIREGESVEYEYWDSRWRLAAFARRIAPDMLAPVVSNIAVPLDVRVSFTASGATGTMIDVTVWNAAAPFALRIIRAELRVSTAVGATVAALRTASGGGGSVVLPDAAVGTQTFVTDATGVFEDNAVATATVAAAGSLFLNIDRAIAGELVLYCMRT